MGTYVAGQTVYAYFQTYVQHGDPSETIVQQSFSAAINAL